MKNIAITIVLALALVSCSKNDAIDCPANRLHDIKFFSSNKSIESRNVSLYFNGVELGKINYSADVKSGSFLSDKLFSGTHKYELVEVVGNDTSRIEYLVVVPEIVTGTLFIDIK